MIRSSRLVAALVAVALSAVVLAGCAPEPAETRSTPTGEKVDASLAPFYSQQLVWTGCGGQMQCTTAKAPLDYRSPADGTVKLALVRHQATGKKIGSLLVNPGGPGGSGYDFVKDSLDFAVGKKLQSSFDVVGFDPRGVGRSTAVSCYDPKQMDSYIYDIPPGTRGDATWIAAQKSSSEDFAAACKSNSGALLDNVDTESAARDLDMLRAALGDTSLDYLGYSYGTLLGATYAGLFPDKVGRLVLDGALDPASSVSDVNIEQAKGFESALRAYMTDCLQGKDCPFSGSVDKGMATVRALLDSVEANPIRVADGRMLGASTLLTAIIYPLYTKSGWPSLSAMFESVMQGSAKIAFTFADEYNGRATGGSYKDNSTEAFISIDCLDYSYDDSAAAMESQRAELESAAPIIGTYFAYGDIGCASWPDKTRVQRQPIAAAGAAPILVVGTTNDPATPYVWAQALAKELDSGNLVTYHGEGHTAYNKSNDCVDGAVETYFLSGKVPASDPMC